MPSSIIGSRHFFFFSSLAVFAMIRWLPEVGVSVCTAWTLRRPLPEDAIGSRPRAYRETGTFQDRMRDRRGTDQGRVTTCPGIHASFFFFKQKTAYEI